MSDVQGRKHADKAREQGTEVDIPVVMILALGFLMSGSRRADHFGNKEYTLITKSCDDNVYRKNCTIYMSARNTIITPNMSLMIFEGRISGALLQYTYPQTHQRRREIRAASPGCGDSTYSRENTVDKTLTIDVRNVPRSAAQATV